MGLHNHASGILLLAPRPAPRLGTHSRSLKIASFTRKMDEDEYGKFINPIGISPTWRIPIDFVSQKVN